MSTWQPIETAPKDGTFVLLRCSKSPAVHARYWKTSCGGHWLSYFPGGCDVFDGTPTHWAPLPEDPPAEPEIDLRELKARVDWMMETIRGRDPDGGFQTFEALYQLNRKDPTP